jgi:hypothetical protein
VTGFWRTLMRRFGQIVVRVRTSAMLVIYVLLTVVAIDAFEPRDYGPVKNRKVSYS